MDEYGHRVRNCKDFVPKRFKPGYTSPKLDGVRAFYYPGQGTLMSRQNKPIYGMDHILEELHDFPHALDMELVVRGLEFNKLSGVIRNHNPTPEVDAHIIDAVVSGNLIDRLRLRPLTTSSVSRIPHYFVNSLEQFWSRHIQFLDEGFEGSVWKSVDHKYLNKRDWDWMREVPVSSEDCVITGFYEGTGKMSGMLGGFYIDFKGLKCKVGTLKGIDYAERVQIWENQNEYIGLVIEVQFKNLQPSGKPRQPRMKGFRYDK